MVVYIMVVQVDGGCRGNGKPKALGAAAAVFLKRERETDSRHENYPPIRIRQTSEPK
jgi:ribonuclease HI